MLSLVSNSAARRVASNIRLTSSLRLRNAHPSASSQKHLAKRSFATMGDQQQQQQGGEGEEPSGGIWGKLFLATGLLALGAGTYTYVSWDKLYPDTPFPIPVPDAIKAILPGGPKTQEQRIAAAATTATNDAKEGDEVEDHTTAVHTKPEENFLAEPKSAALLLPEIVEEQRHHAHHDHHHHESSNEQHTTQAAAPCHEETPAATTTSSESAHTQEQAPETAVPSQEQQVQAVITETIASELASNLAAESPEDAAKHTAQIAEIQPQIEEAAAQATSSVVELFGEQAESGQPEETSAEQTSEAAAETPAAQKIYTEEELNALLLSQREEIMEQTAHFLRGWGEQQATISGLKDKLLETKEELERVEREYEERIQELQEQNTHQINRIRFEATTEKLAAVEDAIKEGEYLCELKNAKLHEQRVKQIADVYQRVLQLNANLNQNYVSQGEQLRQQICLALVDTLIALQQNKSQLNQELHRLFELARNRDDILEALNQIPQGFVSGGDLVQSREHLKKRFGYVQQIARTQALVPDDGGLWWQLGAALASRLLSPIPASPTPLEGQSEAESILSKAAYYLEQDDLAAAVTEVEKLSGNAREVVESWINDTKRRVRLESSLHLAVERVYNTIVS